MREPYLLVEIHKLDRQDMIMRINWAALEHEKAFSKNGFYDESTNDENMRRRAIKSAFFVPLMRRLRECRKNLSVELKNYTNYTAKPPVKPRKNEK